MAWDGSPSRFTDEQYRASCVLDRGGDGPVKSRYGLPVREPDGTLNCDGVAAARQRIGQVTGASEEALAAARSKLEKLAAQCQSSGSESRTRPQTGTVEQRAIDATGAVAVDGRKLRGLIPYGVESRDLGGWKEVIDRGALRNTRLDDLIATREHDRAHLLGRYPTTLTTEDRSDGFAWTADLPSSPVGEDVRVALERGDLRSSSWRMVVAPGGERWDGDVRHVTNIAELRDVTVTAAPAYGDEARAEYRSLPEAPTTTTEEATVPEEAREGGGGLTVESRSAPETRSGAGTQGDIETRVLDSIQSVPPGEVRSLTTTSASPIDTPELATYVFDKLRPASVMLASGIRVMATTRERIVWPRTITDVDPSWTAEGDEITEGDPAWDELTVIPSKLAHRILCSNESLEDAPIDLLGWLQGHLYTLLGLKLDIGLLEGNPIGGAPGVQGLKFQSGVQLIHQATDTGNGAFLTDLDAIAQASGLIREANGEPGAIVMHPSIWTAAEQLKDSTGRYLLGPALDPSLKPPRALFGLPVFVTSALSNTETRGTSNDCSSIYVFDPSQVVLVRRVDVQIEVDRYQFHSSDQTQIRARLRVGFVLPRPETVVRIDGIRPGE